MLESNMDLLEERQLKAIDKAIKTNGIALNIMSAGIGTSVENLALVNHMIDKGMVKKALIINNRMHVTSTLVTLDMYFNDRKVLYAQGNSLIDYNAGHDIAVMSIDYFVLHKEEVIESYRPDLIFAYDLYAILDSHKSTHKYHALQYARPLVDKFIGCCYYAPIAYNINEVYSAFNNQSMYSILSLVADKKHLSAEDINSYVNYELTKEAY